VVQDDSCRQRGGQQRHRGIGTCREDQTAAEARRGKTEEVDDRVEDTSAGFVMMARSDPSLRACLTMPDVERSVREEGVCQELRLHLLRSLREIEERPTLEIMRLTSLGGLPRP
jgi:hypothetical protein